MLPRRPQHALRLDGRLDWTPNICLGTSIESGHWLRRLEPLRHTGARTKFLLLQALLGLLPDLDLQEVEWVIASESGLRARPTQADWVRDIRDSCLVQKVPFFFKHW